MKVTAVLLTLVGCTGWIENGAAGGPTGDHEPNPTGDAAPTVAGTLTVSFTTAHPPAGDPVRARGVYLWIEDSSGGYIDTVEQYFGRIDLACLPNELAYYCMEFRYYDDACLAWVAAVGETVPLGGPVGAGLVLDGVTKASAYAYDAGVYTSEAWDCRDHNGQTIAPGTYTVHMEITWERDDGLGHTRPCEQTPAEFPECSFLYSATIALGGAETTAVLSPSDWMASGGEVTFTPY